MSLIDTESFEAQQYGSATRDDKLTALKGKFNKISFVIDNSIETKPTVNRTISYINRQANDFVEDILKEAFKALKLIRSEAEGSVKTDDATSDKSSDSLLDSHNFTFALASTIVDNVLKESFRRVAIFKFLGINRLQSYSSPEDFNVKDGLEIVAKCLSKWTFNPSWYYRTIYHGRLLSESCSYSYFYTVRWSVPTPSYPVGQVTADVHFTVKVSPMKPPPVHIEVLYRMETDCSEHEAFSAPFLEKWLQTVVKRKLQSFQLFKF